MNSGFQYRRFEGIEQLPPEYEALFAAAEARSFYFGLDWLRLLSRHGLGNQESITVHGVEGPDGRPLVALPIRSTVPSDKADWQFESLANYYTSLFSPVYSTPGPETAAALSALPRLLREHLGCDSINLRPMAHDDEDYATLLSGFRTAGWATQDYFCFGNWYLKVDGRSYDQYSEALPSATRNTIKRKTKKFEAAKGTYEIVTSSENIEKYIGDYTKIYNSSWKVVEPHPEFVPGLIRLSAARDWLRLGVAYVDGEPAAAQIWITENGRANIYKLAYDEKFAAQSVGTILTVALFRHALDVDKVHTVDYLTGDDAYKRDWMSHRRERWGILAFNPTRPRGLYGAMRHILPHHFKKMFKISAKASS